QDPNDWWEGVCRATRELFDRDPGLRDRIAAVGVSGQGAAATLLDEAGRAVRPAILWLDARAAGQALAMQRAAGDRIAARSGKAPAAYNVEPKLAWVREHEPLAWERTWKVMTTTGYVTFRLSGRPVMNRSDAGILLAYDLFTGDWS